VQNLVTNSSHNTKVSLQGDPVETLLEGQFNNTDVCLKYPVHCADELCKSIESNQVCIVAPTTSLVGQADGYMESLISGFNTTWTFEYKLLIPRLRSLDPTGAEPGTAVAIAATNFPFQLSSASANADCGNALVSSEACPKLSLDGTEIATTGLSTFTEKGLEVLELGFTVEEIAEYTVDTAVILNLSFPAGGAEILRNFTYEAPLLPRVSTLSARSGRPIEAYFPDMVYESFSATVDDIPAQLLGQTVVVTFADLNGGADKTASSSVAFTNSLNRAKVDITPPSHGTGAEGSTTVTITFTNADLAITKSVTFQFEYIGENAPSVNYFLPAKAQIGVDETTPNVEDITVVLFKSTLPSADQITATAELDGTTHYFAVSQVTDSLTLVIQTPGTINAAAEAGTYAVTISWETYSVSFDLEFLAPPEGGVVAMSPTQGPVAGGTVITLEVANLGNPASLSSYGSTTWRTIDELIVEFTLDGQDPETATINEIVYSAVDKSKVTFTTPAVDTAGGSASVSIYLKTLDTYKIEKYQVSGDAVTFKFNADTDPVVTSVAPTSGFMSGSSIISLAIIRFPKVDPVTDPRDIKVTVGDNQVSVRSVYSKTEDDGTFTTTMELQLPEVSTAGTQAVNIESYAEEGLLVSFDFLFWTDPTAPAVISSVTPERLPIDANTQVTIWINNFGGVPDTDGFQVEFASEVGENVKVVSYYTYTEIVVKTPAIADVGEATLFVFKTGDREAGVQLKVNFYNPNEPAVVQKYPTQGTELGGTSITVQIENFPRSISSTSELAVTFDSTSVAADQIAITSAYYATILEVTITTPAFAGGGDATLSIVASVGVSQYTATTSFTFTPLPTVAAVIEYVLPSDKAAASEGGTAFTVQLSNFYTSGDETSITVKFDTTDATVTSLVQTGDLYKVGFTSPAVAAGTYSVTVYPTDRSTNVATFDVVVSDTQASLTFNTPPSGQPATTMIVKVQDLPADTTFDDLEIFLYFDPYRTDAESGSVTYDSTTATHTVQFPCPAFFDSQLAAVTSVTATVRLITDTSQSVSFSFYYIPSTYPHLAAFSQRSAPQYGGITIQIVIGEISATDAADAAVSFGGTASASVVVSGDDSSATLDVEIPSQTSAGYVDGVVTLPGLTADHLLFKFLYESPPTPTVKSVSPSEVESSGGSTMYLTVVDLPTIGGDVAAKFGSSFATVKSTKTNTDGSVSVKVTTPALDAGTIDVQVFRTGSVVSYLKATTTVIYYDVSAPRVVVGPTPDYGTVTGGTQVQVDVENLGDLSTVPSDLAVVCGSKVGSVVSTTAINTKTLRVYLTTPGAASSGDAICEVYAVADGAGTGATFTYTYTDDPRITSVLVSKSVVYTKGGQTMRVTIVNFPAVAAASDVMLFYGDSPTESFPDYIVTSDATATTFVAKTAEVSAPGAVVVTVAATADRSKSATFTLNYESPPPALIDVMNPTRAFWLDPSEGGTNVSMTLINFPVTTDMSNVLVNFGLNNPAIIFYNQFESNDAYTSLIVQVPERQGLNYDVEVSVISAAEPSMLPATHAFSYMTNVPEVSNFFPTTGKSGGGTSFIVTLTNVVELSQIIDGGTTPDQFAIEFDSVAATVDSMVLHPCVVPTSCDASGYITLRGTAPEHAPADSVVGEIKPFGLEAYTVSFDFSYFNSSAPYVPFLHPTSGPNMGFTIVRANVINFPQHLQTSDVGVTFDGVAGTVTGVVDSTNSDGEDVVTVISRAPAFAGADTIDLELAVIGTNKLATVSYTFFETCDFASYCAEPGRDKVPDYDKLESSPPTSSTCSSSYCKEPPPPATIASVVASETLFKNSGGEEITLTINYFPIVDSTSDVLVMFGTTSATLAGIISSKVTQTKLRILTPDLEPVAGVVTVTVTHVTSRTPSSVSFEVEFFQVPTGPPVISTFTPSTTIWNREDGMRLQLTNCPELTTATSEVSVKFGSVTATTLSVIMTSRITAEVFLTIPDYSGNCDDDCTAQVSVNLVNYAGRTGYFDYPLIQPELRIVTVNPNSAVETGGDRVALTMENLPAGTTMENIVVKFGSTTAEAYYGEKYWSDTLVNPATRSDTLVLKTPDSSPVGELLITVEAGSFSKTANFEFLAANAPNFASFSPATLQATGGDTLALVVEYPGRTTSLDFAALAFTVNLCSSDFTYDATSSSNTITMNWESTTKFEFSLTSPVCEGSSSQTLTMTIDSQTATEVLTYVPPAVVLTPAYGVVTGGSTVTIVAFGYPSDMSSNLGDLSITFSGQAATIASVAYDSSTKFSTITVGIPSSTTAGAVSGSITHTSVAEQTFQFTYMAQPVISAIIPDTGFVDGGETVVITMTDFPEFDEKAQVRVMLNGARVIPRSVGWRKDQQTVELVTPATSSAVKAVLLVTHDGAYSQLNAPASGTYNYEIRVPAVNSASPTSGTKAGGTEITVELADFQQISSASELTITFSGATVAYGTVKNIEYSDSKDTKLVIISPNVVSAGQVTVEIASEYSIVDFAYTFLDSAITAVVTGSSSGPTEGGSVLSVQVTNFPSVSNPLDLIVQFGDILGEVTSASSSYNENYDLVAAISVTSPAAANTLLYTDGFSAVDTKVTVLSDGSAVIFPFSYQEQLAITGSSFTDGYTKINIFFNQPTDGGDSGVVVECDSVLARAALVQLGSNPECQWQSSSVFQIRLGLSFTVYLTAKLSVLGDSIRPINTPIVNNTLTLPATEVLVEDDPNAAPPVSTLFGQNEIGVCDPIDVDGSASTGSKISFKWDCTNDDDLSQVLQTKTDSKIYVDASRLTKTDFDYSIKLIVQDFVGRQSTPEFFIVRRKSLDVPKIKILGEAYQKRLPNEQVKIDAYADFSACAKALADSFQIIFEWTQSPDDEHQLTTGSDGQTVSAGRLLIIKADSMQASKTYTFNVVGYPTGTRANAGTATVTVEASKGELVAVIAGGSREVTNQKDMVLDGTDSVDPSGIDQAVLLYTWKCIDVQSGRTCRRQLDGAALTFSSSSTATIPALSLPPGEYDFTLEVSTTDRFDSTTVRVTMNDNEIPEAKLCWMDCYRDPQIELDTKKVINAETSLKLAAETTYNVTGRGVNGTDAVITWSWSISPSTGSNGDIINTGPQPNKFIVEGNQMKPGQRYVITATATESIGQLAGSATFSVKINMPPTPGTCTVTPSEGVSLETEFAIQCDGWSDCDSETRICDKLKYTFGYTNGGGSPTTLQYVGETNSLDLGTLPGGEGVNSTVDVFAEVVDSYGAVYTTEYSVIVTDKFAGLTESETAAAAENLLSNIDDMANVGDSGGSLALLGNLASLLGASGRRLQESVPESVPETSLQMQMYESLQSILDNTYLSKIAGTTQNAVASIAAVTRFVDGFDVPAIQALVNRTSGIADSFDDEQITSAEVTHFVTVLSNLMSSSAMGLLRQTLPIAETVSLRNQLGHIRLQVAQAFLRGMMVDEEAVTLTGATDDPMSLTIKKIRPWEMRSDTVRITSPTADFSIPLHVLPATDKAIACLAFSSSNPFPSTNLSFGSALQGLQLAEDGDLKPLTVQGDIGLSFYTDQQTSPECQALDAESLQYTMSGLSKSTSVIQGVVSCTAGFLGEYIAVDSPPEECARYSSCLFPGRCDGSQKQCLYIPTLAPTAMPTLAPTGAPTDVSEYIASPEPVIARMRLFVETETVASFSASKQAILKSAISAVYSYAKLALEPAEIELVLGSAGERHLLNVEDVIRTHQLAIAEAMNIDLSAVEIDVSGTARHLQGGITIEVLMSADDAVEAEQFEHEARSEFFTAELAAELQRRGMNLLVHLQGVGTEQQVPTTALYSDAPITDVGPAPQQNSDLLLVYIFGVVTALAVGVVAVWLHRRSRREERTIPSQELAGAKSPKKSPIKKLKAQKIFVYGNEEQGAPARHGDNDQNVMGSSELTRSKPSIPELTSTLKQPRAAFNLGKDQNLSPLPSPTKSANLHTPTGTKAPQTPVQPFRTPVDVNVDVHSPETESEIGFTPQTQPTPSSTHLTVDEVRHDFDGENPRPYGKSSGGPPLWMANSWTSEEDQETRVASDSIES
jgi:hypothetical protein